MSDFPDAMTKQILSAPPRSMRSTRYSLTAQGRSVPPSRRLPTGRSSLEKARGWMRLPRPAAGTMPHMSGAHRRGGRCFAQAHFAERPHEVVGALRRGVLGKHPFTHVLGEALHLG